MKKLSEIRGEDAIEILGDVLEPAIVILSDEEVKDAFKGEDNRVKCVTLILKKHKHEIVEILAALEQVPVEQYKDRVNVFTLPIKVLEILNDKDLTDFLSSLPEQDANLETLFGPATENTVDEEQ